MVEFQTMESTDIKFGTNNFIEVSRKKAVTEEGENIFVSLSRGFFGPNGEKRYRKNFSLPNNQEVLGGVLDALNSLKDAASSEPAEKPAEEAPAAEAPAEEQPSE